MKKILAMVVAMVMVLGMVGCGKSEAPAQSTETNVTTVDSTKETTSTDNVIVSPTDTQKADGIVRIEEIHFENIESEDGQCVHSDILKTDRLKVNGDMAGIVYVTEYADGEVQVETVYYED